MLFQIRILKHFLHLSLITRICIFSSFLISIQYHPLIRTRKGPDILLELTNIRINRSEGKIKNLDKDRFFQYFIHLFTHKKVTDDFLLPFLRVGQFGLQYGLRPTG